MMLDGPMKESSQVDIPIPDVSHEVVRVHRHPERRGHHTHPERRGHVACRTPDF